MELGGWEGLPGGQIHSGDHRLSRLQPDAETGSPVWAVSVVQEKQWVDAEGFCQSPRR